MSMMLFRLGQNPLSIACAGGDRSNVGTYDVCNVTMAFEGNRVGVVDVSWLDPRKESVRTIVGDK